MMFMDDILAFALVLAVVAVGGEITHQAMTRPYRFYLLRVLALIAILAGGLWLINPDGQPTPRDSFFSSHQKG